MLRWLNRFLAGLLGLVVPGLELVRRAFTVGVLALSMMQWVAADSKPNVRLYSPLFFGRRR